MIPAPCVAELYRGSTPTSKGRTSVEALLVDYEVAVLDRAAAELAGNLVGEARRRGVTIALPDALIAGIAMRRSATLVSLDSDFARIPGLTLETY